MWGWAWEVENEKIKDKIIKEKDKIGFVMNCALVIYGGHCFGRFAFGDFLFCTPKKGSKKGRPSGAGGADFPQITFEGSWNEIACNRERHWIRQCTTDSARKIVDGLTR